MLPFPDKILDFHPPKFLMTLYLVIDHKFTNFELPLFSLFQHISPLFRQNYYFTFKNCPPCFLKFTCFLHYFLCILFPPTLTMMHLCITQCTYWTTLPVSEAATMSTPAVHWPHSVLTGPVGKGNSSAESKNMKSLVLRTQGCLSVRCMHSLKDIFFLSIAQCTM